MDRRIKTLNYVLKLVLVSFMVFVMMLAIANTIAYANDTSNEPSEQTILDISKGDITIGEGSVSGYDENGNEVLNADADGYTIIGETTQYVVNIIGGTHNITFKGVNINVNETGTHDKYGYIEKSGKIACSIINGSNVSIELIDDNTLKSGIGCAGLNVLPGATITIDGSGRLNATGNEGGAGIGSNSNEGYGTIIINGGDIVATGSYFGAGDDNWTGAGIGGSGWWDYSSETITINGGTIIANGEWYRGGHAADIGAGTRYNFYHDVNVSGDATVIINGGCIKADMIGAGTDYSGCTGYVINSSNEPVTLVTVTFEDVDGRIKISNIAGIEQYGCNQVNTIDGKLYMYIPEAVIPTLISTSEGFYEGTIFYDEGWLTKHDCSFDIQNATYAADDEEDIISVTCNTCGTDMGRVCLYAPVNNGATDKPLFYDGTEKYAMSMYYEGTYIGCNSIDGFISDIEYIQDGTILDGPPVYPGNYMASIAAPDGQMVYVHFTIFQAIPDIGTVTVKEDVLYDTLDINEVALERTNEEVAGFLYMTDTELKYGTHTYNWEFIPDNPNFATITGTVEITVNDTIKPTVNYRIDAEDFKEFTNNAVFKTFYDSYKAVEIVYSDNDNGSGIDIMQYYIASEAITDTSSVAWIDYTGTINLDAEGRYIIYVRVVDNAGNEVIKHSEGIVIYNDSVMDSYIINGLYKDNADSLVQVTLNGNTINNILDNDGNVLDASSYTVSVNGDTALVKISADYLNSLKAGNYTYTIFFAPQGVETDTVELSCEFIVNMNKEEIWVSSALTTDRLYDGSNLVDVISVVLQNVRLGDDVKVDISNLKGTLASADAGYYILVTLPQLTLIGEDADNYILVQPTEAVQTRVTISQAKTSIGTVTASVPDNTLDVDKVVLERTDKTLAGSLTLLQTELQYGVHTYSWMFVPDDANYETITGTVEITAKDTINPTVTYRIDTEDFKEFTNSVAFEKFYDAYKTFEIVCGDNENGSGIKLMQYYVASEAITDMSSIQWENYTGAIDLNTEGTYIIYVRVVDNEGNEVIKHTEGIVIYKYVDMLQDAIDGTYKLNDTGFLQIMLNGNAIDKISDNNGNILDANTYTVIQNGDTTIIYFEANYLNSLKAGNYSYTIYFNPCGIETGAVELTSNFEVNIAKVQIQVSGASAIDRIYDGTKLVNIRDVALDGIMYGDDVRIDVSGLKGTLESADAGTYRLVTLPQLTLMGADADNYIFIQSTEPVATNVTISQVTPDIGTVTAGILNDTLDISKVVLDRTDKTIAGSLKLTSTQLSYGTYSYNWQFVPESSNYKTITGTVKITVNDTIVPTIKYEISGTTDGFKDCADKVVFKTFFDSYKTINLVKSDGESSSGLGVIWYYIASEEIIDTSDIEWERYAGSITLDKPGRYVIYMRVVDHSNNEFIGHTEGIVIYDDSVMDSNLIEGVYETNKDSFVYVTLNGNTIKDILDSNGKPLDTSAYLVSITGDKAKVTLKAAYLNTLKGGKHTYTICFNPQGVEIDKVELKAKFTIKIAYVQLSISAQAESSHINVGDKVFLSATATGGDGNYTYSFLIHNKDTNKWARLTENFTENNSLIWRATSAGNREIFIEVKDGTGKVVRSEALNVDVTKKLSITGEATLSQVLVGQSIQLAGKATGGDGDYTYSYLVYNKATGKWARLTEEFVENNNYTWKAKTLGDRVFYIEVKDGYGNVVRSKAIEVKVVKKLAVKANVSSSNVKVGKKVVLSAEASGGIGDYTYSFIVYNKLTNKWCRLADNITSAQYTWKAVSAGDRVFFVDVKDSTGKIVRSKAVEVSVE